MTDGIFENFRDNYKTSDNAFVFSAAKKVIVSGDGLDDIENRPGETVFQTPDDEDFTFIFDELQKPDAKDHDAKIKGDSFSAFGKTKKKIVIKKPEKSAQFTSNEPVESVEQNQLPTFDFDFVLMMQQCFSSKSGTEETDEMMKKFGDLDLMI